MGSHCFNCGEEGHQWHECTKPLKESLRMREGMIRMHKNQSLNRDGGAGAKGVQPPQVGMAQANTAKANN